MGKERLAVNGRLWRGEVKKKRKKKKKRKRGERNGCSCVLETKQKGIRKSHRWAAF